MRDLKAVLLVLWLALIGVEDTYTCEVSQVLRDDDPPILQAHASILARLLVVSMTFEVSSFFSCNWLGDPLAIPLERCSFLVAPPATKVLDHLQRVAMNGEAANMLEIGNEINWFKLVDVV